MTIVIWYLDSIKTSDNGVGRPYLFFLSSSYWFDSKTKIKTQLNEDYQQSQSLNVSEDVSDEIQKLNEIDEQNSLRVIGIEKTFNALFKTPVQAVRGVNMVAEKGSCISLLGHNGAGKT